MQQLLWASSKMERTFEYHLAISTSLSTKWRKIDIYVHLQESLGQLDISGIRGNSLNNRKVQSLSRSTCCSSGHKVDLSPNNGIFGSTWPCLGILIRNWQQQQEADDGCKQRDVSLERVSFFHPKQLGDKIILSHIWKIRSPGRSISFFLNFLWLFLNVNWVGNKEGRFPRRIFTNAAYYEIQTKTPHWSAIHIWKKGPSCNVHLYGGYWYKDPHILYHTSATSIYMNKTIHETCCDAEAWTKKQRFMMEVLSWWVDYMRKKIKSELIKVPNIPPCGARGSP